MGIAVTPVSRSFPRADPRARPRTCEARRSAGSAAGELPPRGGREEYMKGPRPARMPVYGAGSKYLGRTQKETGWLRSHAPQPPAIPIAPLHATAPRNSHCTPTLQGQRRLAQVGRGVTKVLPRAV
jgi:hypothetical protein